MGFDLSVFIGRFHPLFVHLPIGMIILTLILELIGKSSRKTLSWMWLISFATSLLSIFTGYQLTLDSSYPGGTLFWHKWLGVTVAASSLIIYLLSRFGTEGKNLLSNLLKAMVAVVLTIGGHLGGQLTHGNGYLVEAAPNFIKSVLGYEQYEKQDISELNADSIIAYEHIIYPILEQKCVQCHTPEAASGKLVMTNQEALLEGGDGGAVIVPGEASESELFRRVTLEQSNVKFMPTKGEPMTYHEMELLKWWINKGAKFDTYAGQLEMPSDVIEGIQKLYNVDFSPRPWYEKDPGPPIDTVAMEQFAKQGFKVTDLSASDHYLEISALEKDLIANVSFDKISRNVLILDLENTDVSEALYPKISGLTNLLRLELNNTPTNSEDVMKIKPLPKLEAINLFGSEIDDKALEHLASFPSLKRIYTWQTKVTADGIAQLQSSRPDIVVENGIN